MILDALGTRMETSIISVDAKSLKLVGKVTLDVVLGLAVQPYERNIRNTTTSNA